MNWPWSRHERNARSTLEVESAGRVVDQQLNEARALRAAAQEVGSSLDQGRDANHYAMALAAVFSKGTGKK